MRARLHVLLGTLVLVGLVAAIAIPFAKSTKASPPPPNFRITPLPLTDGSSEPEISIGQDGTMGIVSLRFLFDQGGFATHLWTGSFGSTPTHQGIVDATLQKPGKVAFGGADADVDIGSTGQLHITTLVALVSATSTHVQFGVSAITCPSPAASSFSISQCRAQLIGTTNDDRPWITSDGPHVYLSYHDPAAAALIDVQRSDDDGFTWQQVGDPMVGQAGTTADAGGADSTQGKLIADPFTHTVYDIYAAGETGVLKGHTFTPNHIIVSESHDLGKTWTAHVAFTAAPGTSLADIFPALAVDPTNGNLYAVWSDGQTVSFASSTDQGSHWSSPVMVSRAPANTAVLPWVAASNGTVDVVYYGTTAASNVDPTAAWHVYFAQTTDNGVTFTQTRVNASANHVGVICTRGAACGPGTRNLLDLFQVAIDPQNGKAAISYVDDTLTTSDDPTSFACLPNQAPPCPLPQTVLAQQN